MYPLHQRETQTGKFTEFTQLGHALEEALIHWTGEKETGGPKHQNFHWSTPLHLSLGIQGVTLFFYIYINISTVIRTYLMLLCYFNYKWHTQHFI